MDDLGPRTIGSDDPDRARLERPRRPGRTAGPGLSSVLSFGLTTPDEHPLSVLVVGVHPDDIEIGAGGTLLNLAATQPGLAVHYVVLTGTAQRHDEARLAAESFLAARRSPSICTRSPKAACRRCGLRSRTS